MKKILLIVLALALAMPAYARRTDMMSSYGHRKSYDTNKTKRNQHVAYARRDALKYCGNNRYDKELYSSRAAQMLYENEHYNNTVDCYRYLKELRQIDLERRRQDLDRRR